MKMPLLITLFLIALSTAKKHGGIPKSYVLNLDLPPQDRWTEMVSENKDKIGAATDYFTKFIPSWIQPYADKIGESLESYFVDYHGELEGISKASGVNLGELVLLNMVYQLEDLFAQGCELRNTTGPCKGQKATATWCTSIISNSPDGIVMGRNLDFNFPNPLLELVTNIDYQKGGKTIFTGTTLMGFVGTMNAMKPGKFVASLNARSIGGNVLENFLSLLLEHSMTPSQLIRKTFETCDDLDCVMSSVSSTKLVNPAYFTIGGVNNGEGAIISRDRLKAADIWKLTDADKGSQNWYKAQTNYDHWESVPEWDNRRDPANKYVQQLGINGVNVNSMYSKVMTVNPVFNDHTDWTAIICPKTGFYNVTVWFDDN